MDTNSTADDCLDQSLALPSGRSSRRHLPVLGPRYLRSLWPSSRSSKQRPSLLDGHDELRSVEFRHLQIGQDQVGDPDLDAFKSIAAVDSIIEGRLSVGLQDRSGDPTTDRPRQGLQAFRWGSLSFGRTRSLHGRYPTTHHLGVEPRTGAYHQSLKRLRRR